MPRCPSAATTALVAAAGGPVIAGVALVGGVGLAAAGIYKGARSLAKWLF